MEEAAMEEASVEEAAMEEAIAYSGCSTMYWPSRSRVASRTAMELSRTGSEPSQSKPCGLGARGRLAKVWTWKLV